MVNIKKLLTLYIYIYIYIYYTVEDIIYNFKYNILYGRKYFDFDSR